MPKLHKDFHAPRIEAYDIAIASLEYNCDSRTANHAERVERRQLIKRLQREKKKHAEKFGIEI